MRKWIITLTTLAAILSIIYVLVIAPEIYRTETLLKASSEEKGGGYGQLLSQFGGLASVAGLSGGLSTGHEKSLAAIKIMQSQHFIAEFIRSHKLEAAVIAGSGWDAETNTIVYDHDSYNASTNTWEFDTPNKTTPSDWELFDAFQYMYSISYEPDTQFVTLKVDYYSPYLAKAWADLLVRQINDYMREQEVAEAERSISYLKEQIAVTNITEMKEIFFQLIESQTKTIMLANVRDEYLFKTIVPSIVPELRYSPKRARLVIFVTLMAGFAVSFGAIGFHYLQLAWKEESRNTISG